MEVLFLRAWGFFRKMGSFSHFSRALPASIWGCCSQVLVLTSIWGTQNGVWQRHVRAVFPSISVSWDPQTLQNKGNAKWQIDPVLHPPPHNTYRYDKLFSKYFRGSYRKGGQEPLGLSPRRNSTEFFLGSGKSHRCPRKEKGLLSKGGSYPNKFLWVFPGAFAGISGKSPEPLTDESWKPPSPLSLSRV